MSIQKHKKWFFPGLLLCGLVAYGLIYYFEERPYTGSVTEINGVVEKTQYVYGGAASGRSFTRVYLQNGRTYRLPVGQMVGAQQGDEITLVVPHEAEMSGKNDILAISFKVRRKERYPEKPG